MVTVAILALKLGRGCLWASGDDAAEAAAGRMVQVATLTDSWCMISMISMISNKYE